MFHWFSFIQFWTNESLTLWFLAGSFSRSAVNYNAGAKTAISNIVMAATVLITLLFLMPLFYYTPNVILAAIIITAVIGLIDYESAFKLWKVDKLDFLACICSFFGVLFVSVPLGLAVAVSSVCFLWSYIDIQNIRIASNCVKSMNFRWEYQYSRFCFMWQDQTQLH